VPKILDALALASMEKPAQLQRIAALWCRGESRTPYNSNEVRKWVNREFGALFDEGEVTRRSRELLDEIKKQSRLRERRAKRRSVVDPCTTPAGSQIRLVRLLQARLGPARRWVKQSRAAIDFGAHYMDGDLYSGLVAGLIPVQIKLRSISNPNLLVYRYRWGETRTAFVATHITTVADAFIWLIPPEAAEFLQLPGTRVEHDGDAQTVRLDTQFGSKILPWRTLTSP